MRKQIVLFPVLAGMLLAGCQSAENLVDTTERVVTSIPRKQLKKINSFKEIKSNPGIVSEKSTDDPLYHVNLLGDSAIMQSLRLVTLQEIPGFSMLSDKEKNSINGDYEKEAAMATRRVYSVDVDEAANRIFVCMYNLFSDHAFHYYIFEMDGKYVGEVGNGYDYIDCVMPHFSVDRENRQLVLTSENNVLVYNYNGKLLSMNAMPYAMTAVQRLGDYWLCCPSGSPSWTYVFFIVNSSKKLTDKDKQIKLNATEEKYGSVYVNTDYIAPVYTDVKMNDYWIDSCTANKQDLVHCAVLTDADFSPVRKIMHVYPQEVNSLSDVRWDEKTATKHIDDPNYNIDNYDIALAGNTTGGEWRVAKDLLNWDNLYTSPSYTKTSNWVGVTLATSGYDFSLLHGYCIGSSPNGATYYLDKNRIWQIHSDKATLVMDLSKADMPMFTSFKMSDTYAVFGNTTKDGMIPRHRSLRIVSRSSLKPYNVTATSSTNDLNNVLFRAAQSRARNYEEMSPLDITKSGEWVYAAYPRAIKELAMDHADSWSEADRKTLHDIDVKGSITLVFVTPKPESQWQAK